jgi:hypothetical protein
MPCLLPSRAAVAEQSAGVSAMTTPAPGFEVERGSRLTLGLTCLFGVFLVSVPWGVGIWTIVRWLLV